MLLNFFLRNDASTSVLLLTGTHGDGGVTGLADKNKLDRGLYVADCKRKKIKILTD